jgi:hypothetical protein
MHEKADDITLVVARASQAAEKVTGLVTIEHFFSSLFYAWR